jgi:hypothetical protein
MDGAEPDYGGKLEQNNVTTHLEVRVCWNKTDFMPLLRKSTFSKRSERTGMT